MDVKNITEIVEEPSEVVNITSVDEYDDSWQFTVTSGWSFAIPKKYGIQPHEHDLVHVYSNGVGLTVRGIALNGVVVYYRTKEEQKELNKKAAKEYDEQQKAEFEANKAKLDASYEALPDVFKRRIDKFRNTNPNFRWKYEKYEMFCCEEALKIATGTWPDGSAKTADSIDKFHHSEYKEQKLLVSTLDEGHSGNTFGLACLLAKLYLSDPEMVVKMHGALAPLVGCKEYGCPHPDAKEKEE